MGMNPGNQADLQYILKNAGLPAPRSLTLAITQNCNLACVHCWPESGAHAIEGSLEAKALEQTIESFIRLGVKELTITGGEPLTHPGWLDILRFSLQQPGLETLCLQTNATMLTEADVYSLTALQWSRLIIQVSLDGASAPINDAIRGGGSFAAAWRGLNLLVEAGLAANCKVAFTETRQNIHELPELVIRLHRMGIGAVISGTLVCAGRAQSAGQLSLPEPRQYEELLERFHTDAEFRESYRAMGNIAALEWYRGRGAPDDLACKCGEHLYIDGKGILYPCTMLPFPQYAVAQVHQRSVAEVLSQAAASWSNLPGLVAKRRSGILQCRHCAGKEHCAGGCLGRALVSDGDDMAVEDRCLLRKAVYTWEPAGP